VRGRGRRSELLPFVFRGTKLYHIRIQQPPQLALVSDSNRHIVKENGCVKLSRVSGEQSDNPTPTTLENIFATLSRLHKDDYQKNTVLEKRFFFIIPFNPLEMGASGMGKLQKEYVVTRAKTSLYPKRDHLLRLLAKMGLRATVLHQQEVVELYYNIYNPSSTGRQLAPIPTYTNVVMTQ
jgi:hypothetical protein